MNHDDPNCGRESRHGDGLSRWLVYVAARGAPEFLSQRLEEEWLADLSARASALSRLRFALGCCWARRIIARQHFASAVAAAAPVLHTNAAIAEVQRQLGFFSRRTSTLILVVAFHVAVFYVFVTGLSRTVTDVVPPPLQNRALPLHSARELPVMPALPTQLKRMPLDVPIPEFQSAQEPESPDVIGRTTAQPATPASLTPAVPPHQVRQVEGGPGAGFPNPDDFYPMMARHMGEQGVATLQVCVDVNGHLAAAPTVLQSTGSSKLDDGALKLAKAGSGHYRATTEDGHPVASCYPLRIRFQLKN